MIFKFKKFKCFKASIFLVRQFVICVSLSCLVCEKKDLKIL